MTYVITRQCERAGLCVDVCPTDSIHTVEGDEEWPLYYINPDTCIECAACEAECPNEAIFFEDDVPEECEEDIQKNADFFTVGPGQELV
ncbi:MAG TPA: ferredoxin family protein [Chloroflexi bacterium]|nr:ferredoxin family protein [Chloroflexota bacterium]